jgi:hypothetical protein
MAESRGLHRSTIWFFLAVSPFVALTYAVALAAGPAVASSSTQSMAAPNEPLPIPGAFRLPANNGYTFSVVAEPPHAGRSAFLSISVFAKGRGVFYRAPATVTETSMQADLGELGEISVTFHRTNESVGAHCGKRTIQFDSGQYEGKIDFHGEEGYTSVEATTAPGDVHYISNLCGGYASSGPFHRHPRGAELYLRNPGLGPRLSVHKSRPGAAAQISAWTMENSNGILIDRFASLQMPGEDFTYDRRWRTATIRPPAPFAGTAHFDLGKKAGQRWSGDLTVDLPGKAGVALTGPTLRAYLVPSE